MNCDTLLDYALFQLSPRRTRCELFVSGDGKTEKLASGFLKPFVNHLKFAEDQVSHAVHLIKLEVVRRKNATAWFNKGTVERFVRFVSTPEVLELVNTFGEEMSQLEGARKMYSQGAQEQFSGDSAMKSAAAADATKKELLRAIDVRLIAVKQDLSTACARASAAGFSLQSVSELLLFADQFGAFRLIEACKKFLSLHEQRPELIGHQLLIPSPSINPHWKFFNDANVRSSSGSDMSIDEPDDERTDNVRLTISDCSDAQVLSMSTHQQKQPASDASEQLNPDPHHFIETLAEKVEEVPAPTAASSAEPVQQAGCGSRQLSVQDRIHLFESKQKEQSVNANNGGGFSGGTIASRLAGARGENRRNPSDVSVEKLVLRRWSGASDMGVDLNSNNSSNDYKETGSASGTPTSAVNSHLRTSNGNAENECGGLIEESKSHSQLSTKNTFVATTSASSSSHGNDLALLALLKSETQTRDAVPRESFASLYGEPPGLNVEKEQAHAWNHSVDGSKQGGLGDYFVCQSTPKGFSNSWEGAGIEESATCQSNSGPVSEFFNVEMASQIPSRAAPGQAMPTETNQASFLVQRRDQIEADAVVKTHIASVSRLRTFATRSKEAGSKSKGALDSQIQFKASMGVEEGISVKSSSARPQTHVRTYVEQEESRQKSLVVPQVLCKDFSAEVKQGSASQGLRFPGRASGNNQKKNLWETRDEIVLIEGCNSLLSRSRKIKESMEAPLSSSSIEEFHTERQNKCNNELNDVLQMKADELEKLFAEHKLRIYGDQVAYTQRGRSFGDHASKSNDNGPALFSSKQMPEKSLQWQCSSNGVEFDSDAFLRIVDNFDTSDAKMRKIGNHTPSDNSRGKLYSKYMLKRDAKLREECGSKRAQKEAKMKAMHDSLKLSQAEMNARFAEFSVHIHAEKMSSFNAYSTLKIKDQTSGNLTGVGDDEQELSESSSNKSKKLLSNKTLPLTTWASVSSISKHSLKSANHSSSSHRAQIENPVAQSVPNFSDFKNENVKPSMMLSNPTGGQPKNLDQSKSSIGDAKAMKEDRSRQSNSMRKISGTPIELKNLSSLISEEPSNKVPIGSESRQYLKKGNGAYHGSGAVLGKLKSTIMPEELTNKEKPEEAVNLLEGLPDMVHDDVDFGRALDGNDLVMDHTCSYGVKLQQGQESGAIETENDDVKPLSHREDSIFFPSKFISARDAQDSQEESSGSCNSHVHHSLAYTQEASDIEPPMDSPTDSPASWNSHPLNQMMDSEADQMRKKWGSSQIPVIAASSSLQSRRDVAKGFKRLLKFGRKSRGADYLVNDWVSASTVSEGDDDLEDGQGLVPRPSDDFRKSRMGYSITSYDGFNESNIFQDQASLCSSITNPAANFRMSDDHLSGSSIKAPRSFFSLTSFRSKASDSKRR